MLETKVLNSKGQKIVLNELEAHSAKQTQKMVNALGYDIDITSMTAVVKKVSEQRFYQIAPADYLPINVGEGAWSEQLTTYRSFDISGSFETGIINQGGGNARLAQADTAVDSLNLKVVDWAKGIGWTLFQLQQASRTGVWDIVTAKEKSRKTNWDLGIQQIAFIGASSTTGVGGLLNLVGIANNTTAIDELISGMDAAELSALAKDLLVAYRSNCAKTAWPTHFIVPESDYLGFATASSDTFPIKSKLQYLLENFQTMTGNKNFKILPCSYGDGLWESATSDKLRYVLLNYDEESIRMNIPVDYQSTLANTLNGFTYENVGYGQFTGVTAIRPLETLHFTFDPTP